MQAKLTERRVANLFPQDRPYQCHDTEVRGFFIRIEPSGRASWFFDYRRPDGGRRRYRLGAYPAVTADSARGLAKAAAGEVARGQDVQENRQRLPQEASHRRAQTLDAFLNRHYRTYALSHLKSGAFQLSRLEADFADCLGKPMSSINRWWIEGWRKICLHKGLKPTTINRRTQRLHAVLSRAVAMGILERHPMEGLKPLRSDQKGRVRYLSSEEEKRLREALIERETALRASRTSCNQWRLVRGQLPKAERNGAFADRLQPIVLLTLNTGLRRGEVLGLRWTDIDLHHKWLCVRAEGAKNGQTRWVPLNAEAVEVLSGWKQQQTNSVDGVVFPAVDGQQTKRIDKSWRGVTQLAALSDFRFHDLRHHFASRLAQAGVDLNTIRELLGHSDLGMVLRYAHLNPERLAWAVEQVPHRAPSSLRIVG